MHILFKWQRVLIVSMAAVVVGFVLYVVVDKTLLNKNFGSTLFSQKKTGIESNNFILERAPVKYNQSMNVSGENEVIEGKDFLVTISHEGAAEKGDVDKPLELNASTANATLGITYKNGAAVDQIWDGKNSTDINNNYWPSLVSVEFIKVIPNSDHEQIVIHTKVWLPRGIGTSRKTIIFYVVKNRMIPIFSYYDESENVCDPNSEPEQINSEDEGQSDEPQNTGEADEIEQTDCSSSWNAWVRVSPKPNVVALDMFYAYGVEIKKSENYSALDYSQLMGEVASGALKVAHFVWNGKSFADPTGTLEYLKQEGEH